MTIYTSDELKRHLGHDIVTNVYREGQIEEEVTVECEACHEILYSEFKYCQECKRKLNELGKCYNGCDDE